MPKLFEPLHLRTLTLPNRIAVSPMCQYQATDGVANDWHLVHYGGLAQGGAGLLITEAMAVSPEGRISPNDLGLWDDAQVEALAPMLRFVTSMGATPCVQLAHAGRKASCDLPWKGGASIPSGKPAPPLTTMDGPFVPRATISLPGDACCSGSTG